MNNNKEWELIMDTVLENAMRESRRSQYAGMAMQALLPRLWGSYTHSHIAFESFKIADKMIEEQMQREGRWETPYKKKNEL